MQPTPGLLRGNFQNGGGPLVAMNTTNTVRFSTLQSPLKMTILSLCVEIPPRRNYLIVTPDPAKPTSLRLIITPGPKKKIITKSGTQTTENDNFGPLC